MKIFKGCNLIFICLLLTCFLLTFFYLLINKSTVLNSFQERFYQEYNFDEPINLSIIENEINKQITNIGENDITLKDYHIRTFLTKRFDTKYIDVKIYENESISLIVSIDNRDDKHLIIEFNFKKELEDLLLDKIVIFNVEIPKFLNIFFMDNLKKISNLNNDPNSNSMFNIFFPFNKLEIINWEIKNKEIIMKIKFAPNIF